VPRPGTRQQRGYSNQWVTLSAKLRKAQPWCTYCGKTHDLTLDHIVPLARGGTNAVTNLRVLCRSCNGRKQDGRGGRGATEGRVEEPRARFSRNSLS